MEAFWVCFVSLFVAFDVIGTVPLFLGLTQGVARPRLRVIIIESVVTASVVALAFLFFGNYVLQLLGITVEDCMIAGGVLLFVMAMNDLLVMQKNEQHVDTESLGAVPIGVPLIAGPAVLTASVLLGHQYGQWPTAAAIVANIAIVGLALLYSGEIHRLLGATGARTVSKISSLLLSAFAVMLVRKGVLAVVASAQS